MYLICESTAKPPWRFHAHMSLPLIRNTRLSQADIASMPLLASSSLYWLGGWALGSIMTSKVSLLIYLESRHIALQARSGCMTASHNRKTLNESAPRTILDSFLFLEQIPGDLMSLAVSSNSFPTARRRSLGIGHHTPKFALSDYSS